MQTHKFNSIKMRVFRSIFRHKSLFDSILKILSFVVWKLCNKVSFSAHSSVQSLTWHFTWTPGGCCTKSFLSEALRERPLRVSDNVQCWEFELMRTRWISAIWAILNFEKGFSRHFLSLSAIKDPQQVIFFRCFRCCEPIKGKGKHTRSDMYAVNNSLYLKERTLLW